MCYVNGVRVSLAEYRRYKQHQKELEHLNSSLRANSVRRGFDYSEWPVVMPSVDSSDGEIAAMQWGFLPSGIKSTEQAMQFRFGEKDESGNMRGGYSTLNARGEEILSSGKIWRDAALQRRCLILSSGFYEHRHIYALNRRTGLPAKTAVRYPYYISIPSRPLFTMAGIYNEWRDPESGETVKTFALLTTDATGHELMEQVHNSKLRMPVILPDVLAREWLRSGLTEERILALATHQYSSAEMTAWSVEKEFWKTATPEKFQHYPELPRLLLTAQTSAAA